MARTDSFLKYTPCPNASPTQTPPDRVTRPGAAGISGFLVAGFIDRFKRRLVIELMVGGLAVIALRTIQ